MYLMRDELPGAPAEPDPRRRDPDRGHRLRRERRARHLPRPARPDADRGRGHRQELPRLDALGGAQSARVRRRHHRRGSRALRAAARASLDDEFLGPGTRTASCATLDTPSDCAVPGALHLPLRPPSHRGRGSASRRRRDIEELPAVARARDAGLEVEVRVPGLRPADLARPSAPATRRSTPAGSRPKDHPAIARGRRRLPPGGHARRSRTDGTRRRPAPRAPRLSLDLLHRRRRRSRSPSTASRRRAARPSAGSTPAPSATRRCSASARASSRTPTRSASASTPARCRR